MTVIMMFSKGVCLTATFMMATLFCLALPSNGECEGTAEQAISHCFVNYYQLTANAEYYKGQDAEFIRNICDKLRLDIRCTHRKCAGMTQKEVIAVLPKDVVSVMDICVYKDFLEVYARNQFCFLQTATSSERCHNNYEAATQNLLDRVKQGNGAATEKLCLEYNKMVQCIKASVSVSCNEEAAGLVDLLVRPSIRYSDMCPREGVSTTIKPLPTKNPSKSLVIDNEELSVKGAENAGSTTKPLHIVCSFLTLIFIWLAKPV